MVQSTPGIGLRWRDTPRDSLVAVLCCTGAYLLSRDVLSERSFFFASRARSAKRGKSNPCVQSIQNTFTLLDHQSPRTRASSATTVKRNGSPCISLRGFVRLTRHIEDHDRAAGAIIDM